MASRRLPALVLIALVTGTAVLASAGGGEGLLAVADGEQLRVDAIDGEVPVDVGPCLRTLASRRTGMPIAGLSVCRWREEPHIVLVIPRPQRSTVRTYRLDDGRLDPAFADLSITHQVLKAELADLDGDSVAELLVSVGKTTRLDPLPRLRLFVYQWSGLAWVPKWLGSRLAYDLLDFACVPGVERDRVVSLERRPDGQQVVTAYRWIGFGFRGTARPAPAFARHIGAAAGAVWVWGTEGRVAVCTAGPGAGRRWEEHTASGPLQTLFAHEGRLYGFDGQRALHIGPQGPGGGL